MSKEEIVNKLSTAAQQHGLAYREIDWLKPLYLPQDHFMIKMLMHVYGPVSYTHLRAHETVLDLVCRLLLEKKKHTTERYSYTARGLQ